MPTNKKAAPDTKKLSLILLGAAIALVVAVITWDIVFAEDEPVAEADTAEETQNEFVPPASVQPTATPYYREDLTSTTIDENLVSYTLPDGWTEGSCEYNELTSRAIIPPQTAFDCLGEDQDGPAGLIQVTRPQTERVYPESCDEAHYIEDTIDTSVFTYTCRDVVIDGVDGARNEWIPVDPSEGGIYKRVEYVFPMQHNGHQVIARYKLSEASGEPDYADEFDAFVQTFKFVQ